MKLKIFTFLFFILTSQVGFGQDSQEEKMKWWDEARFGMFIHWGVYSELGGEWKGKQAPGYSEHILRSLRIPLEQYKEVAANWNPEKFNAEEWVKLCKEAGMKYMVITSKHHDGFAMWDTHVKGWENYDIVNGTKFGRDPMVELKAACDKYGIKFGFYYSHAQDWSHPYGQRNTVDYNQPTQKGKWYNMPEWQEHRKKSLEYYVKGKSIPQLEEILSKKYDPDIIWFDTSSWLPEDQRQLILESARKVAGPNVIFNSRSARGYADYKSTTDRPAEFKDEGSRYWEAIPTTNESYGYHKMDHSHKPASHFIKLLSKASARGGNLLMNVGPKGDGTIADIDVKILKGIGAWLKVNGEAIYGTEKTCLPVQSWGQTTIKGNMLYLHIHNYPGEKLVLGGLKSKIEKAWLLADPDKKALAFEKTPAGDAMFAMPAEAPDSVVSVVAVECEGDVAYNGTSRLISPSYENTFHVFDGNLNNEDLKYDTGKKNKDCVINWKNKNDFITWENRIEKDVNFDVFVTYQSDKGSENNQFEVTIGDKHFTANVVPGAYFEKTKIGRVSMKRGDATITVKPVNIASTELMKLQKLILEPVQ
ncbi:alpha-L-fucosidase [Maribellus mangrovi]|uniref:alpha-L-fucosidase n=1 Tax=Maribellus mangrovi TaxID=3133146 RepID=UPI0030EE3964